MAERIATRKYVDDKVSPESIMSNFRSGSVLDVVYGSKNTTPEYYIKGYIFDIEDCPDTKMPYTSINSTYSDIFVNFNTHENTWFAAEDSSYYFFDSNDYYLKKLVPATGTDSSYSSNSISKFDGFNYPYDLLEKRFFAAVQINSPYINFHTVDLLSNYSIQRYNVINYNIANYNNLFVTLDHYSNCVYVYFSDPSVMYKCNSTGISNVNYSLAPDESWPMEKMFIGNLWFEMDNYNHNTIWYSTDSGSTWKNSNILKKNCNILNGFSPSNVITAETDGDGRSIYKYTNFPSGKTKLIDKNHFNTETISGGEFGGFNENNEMIIALSKWNKIGVSSTRLGAITLSESGNISNLYVTSYLVATSDAFSKNSLLTKDYKLFIENQEIKYKIKTDTSIFTKVKI